MAKLDAARDRVAKVTGRTPTLTLCYDAGYDGFWLARFLEHRGIECLVAIIPLTYAAAIPMLYVTGGT